MLSTFLFHGIILHSFSIKLEWNCILVIACLSDLFQFLNSPFLRNNCFVDLPFESICLLPLIYAKVVSNRSKTTWQVLIGYAAIPYRSRDRRTNFKTWRKWRLKYRLMKTFLTVSAYYKQFTMVYVSYLQAIRDELSSRRRLMTRKSNNIN